MRAVGLIAINFVREQRWPILVLMIWVVLLAILGLVLDLDKSRNDVRFIFKHLGVYGVASVASQIAWVLFVIAIVLFILHFLSGRSRPVV